MGLVNAAKKKGFRVRCLLEHPEDLGRTNRGSPASIWQLPTLREIGSASDFVTVAGHQCQYPGVDRKKPTRLVSDVKGFSEGGPSSMLRTTTRAPYRTTAATIINSA